MTIEPDHSEGIWKYILGHMAAATFSLGATVSIAKSRYLTAYWEEPLALFLIAIAGSLTFAVVAIIFYIFWQRARNKSYLSVSILLCWAMGITLCYALLYIGLVSIARLPSLVELPLPFAVGVLALVTFIKIEAEHLAGQPVTFRESFGKVGIRRPACLVLLCVSPLIFLNVFRAGDIVSEILKPSVEFSNVKPQYSFKDKTIAFSIERKGLLITTTYCSSRFQMNSLRSVRRREAHLGLALDSVLDRASLKPITLNQWIVRQLKITWVQPIAGM